MAYLIACLFVSNFHCRSTVDRQVVWAASGSVGCAVAKCPVVNEGVGGAPWKKAVIVACDYQNP